MFDPKKRALYSWFAKYVENARDEEFITIVMCSQIVTHEYNYRMEKLRDLQRAEEIAEDARAMADEAKEMNYELEWSEIEAMLRGERVDEG